MDNLDNPIAPQPEVNELQVQCESWRQLVLSALVLLVIIGGTLCIYLRWQFKTVSNELENAFPQVTTILSQYHNRQAPAQDQFVKKLADFGRAHQDFGAVIMKYTPVLPLFGVNTNTLTAPASGAILPAPSNTLKK